MKARLFAAGLALVMGVGLSGCKKEAGEGGDASRTTEAAPETPAAPMVKAVSDKTVEVGCAGCTYHVAGVSGCSLAAAKIDGVVVVLTDSDINPHELGLCAHPKMAKLTGEPKDGKLSVTKLEWVEE